MDNPIPAIPAGYRADGRGNLVPEGNIKVIDQLRDDLVISLISEAKVASHALRLVKSLSLKEIESFIDLSSAEYNTHLGGKKGNVTLTSFDKKYKIERSYAENIIFDERLEIAKQLIDECIEEWSKGINYEIKTLIDRAFSTNRGKVSTARILELRRLAITDPKWLKAMEAIADSISINDTVVYVRFYERMGMTDQYKLIPLTLYDAPLLLSDAAAS